MFTEPFRRIVVICFFLTLLLGLACVIVSAQRQSSTDTAQSARGSMVGRYQHIEGAVSTIFDTQTGKVYLWFPRNEKENRDPYLFVMDPVSGTGTEVEILWVVDTLK